jgi:hypothetical protein
LAPQNQGIGSLQRKSNARKAAVFGYFSRHLGIVAERENAWLSWEDSNSDIPFSSMAFDKSREFPPFCGKCRPGDFCSYQLSNFAPAPPPNFPSTRNRARCTGKANDRWV